MQKSLKNDRKRAKKTYSNLSVLDSLKRIFISGLRHLGTLKILIKIMERRSNIYYYFSRQNISSKPEQLGTLIVIYVTRLVN
jgi:hypothetical protein